MILLIIILCVSVYFEECVFGFDQKSFPPYEIHISKSLIELKGNVRAPKLRSTYIDIIKNDLKDIEKCVCNPQTPEFRFWKKNDARCGIEYNRADLKVEVTEKYAFTCKVYTRSQNVTVHIELEALGYSKKYPSILLSTLDGARAHETVSIVASEGDKTIVQFFANAVSTITNIICEGKTRNGKTYGNGTGLEVYVYQEREAELSGIFSKSTEGQIHCQVNTTLPALPRFTLDILVTVQEQPLQKQLTLREGDGNTKIACESRSSAKYDIASCAFQFVKNTSEDAKPGEIKKTLCTITVADFEELRGVHKIKCRITILDVEEIPVVYTIVMDAHSILPVAIGAGVGVAILIGVAAYLIIKFKAKKPSGLVPKNVDGDNPKPENERYVTQNSLQQLGPPRTKQDDFIVPAVLVDPLPGRKKKRKHKDKIPQPKPTFEDSGEGEYEELDVPLNRGPVPTQPPPINLQSLPRTLPHKERSKSPKKKHSNSLEHKKPKPLAPHKPRSGTIQGNGSRSTAENNRDQNQKATNLKREPPVLEKPKGIIPKEKAIEKVNMPNNFLGELNQKLAKTPKGFTPITAKSKNLQQNADDDDDVYECIEISEDRTDSREMMRPLIEGSRPPLPLPKPMKPPKDKLTEKRRNPETGTRGPETVKKPVLPVLQKPDTPGTQLIEKRPVLRPVVPGKPVYTGKSTEESPNEKVKGNWKPDAVNMEPTFSTKPLDKAFITNQTPNKPPLPRSQVENISEYSSDTVSSDDETNYRLNQQDKIYDEFSSGEEWADFDYIKVELPTHKPGPNPVQNASSNEQRAKDRTGQNDGPAKGVSKPLPPLPQEDNIYENVEELRPTIPYKGARS